MIRELLDAGLMHEDVLSVAGKSLRPFTRLPVVILVNVLSPLLWYRKFTDFLK